MMDFELFKTLFILKRFYDRSEDFYNTIDFVSVLNDIKIYKRRLV